MKKWFRFVLTISLIASIVSVAAGQDSNKPVTNETTTVSVPVPRTSPRVFRNPPHNNKAVHQHGPQSSHSTTNQPASK